jgi:hypothetical protein
VSTPLRPAERAYSLSTRPGWEQFVTAPPRQRPDPLTRAEVRKLPEAARAEYEERRSVWHANLGPLRTPQMRAVHEQLDDIAEGNRQDGDKVKGADAVLACDVRLCVVDDVHFLDPRRRDGRDVADHFKYLATFPVTFIYVGVGLERRGLISEGLAAGEEELAQNARRWTALGVSPFEIATEAGRHTWRHTAHPALVAAAVRLPLLPLLPGRQRRPVDARLAHPLDLRLHPLPGPARRHLPRLRPAPPAHPHRAAPPARPLRPHRPAPAAAAPARSHHLLLHQRPAATPAVALPAGGRVLADQQHADALISALLASRGRPAETDALRQQLDDIYAVARAAASAVNGTAALPPAAAAVLGELAARPGATASQEPGDNAGARPGPVDRYLRQLAPVAAFGTAVADIMLHGRAGDPDPEIAAWLAANGAIRRSQPGPGDMLAVAVTGAADCSTARELIGLHPAHPSDLATFTSRLRKHAILEPVTAAICQLARQLEDNGAPVDYARRRRLPRLSQAQLDVTAWHRQRQRRPARHHRRPRPARRRTQPRTTPTRRPADGALTLTGRRYDNNVPSQGAGICYLSPVDTGAIRQDGTTWTSVPGKKSVRSRCPAASTLRSCSCARSRESGPSGRRYG